MQNAEVHIRDPFVVVDRESGRYTLFGSTDPDIWGPGAIGFDSYVGTNLTDWEAPQPAFRPQTGFWSDRNYWAPEVHSHAGRWFMFASFKSESACRGTQILAADALRGPYAPHSDGPVTPRDWECLDGTFHLEPDGSPWIVFCHEWVQIGDGAICAMPLTPDLRAPAGEPAELFRASDAPWVTPYPHPGAFVTDGPFMHRTAGGALLMLWSSFREGDYAIGVARSEAGGILGPWTQLPDPLFARDGGHGMLFRALDDRLMLTIHTPNRTPDERPIFIEITESNGGLSVAG